MRFLRDDGGIDARSTQRVSYGTSWPSALRPDQGPSSALSLGGPDQNRRKTGAKTGATAASDSVVLQSDVQLDVRVCAVRGADGALAGVLLVALDRPAPRDGQTENERLRRENAELREVHGASHEELRVRTW